MFPTPALYIVGVKSVQIVDLFVQTRYLVRNISQFLNIVPFSTVLFSILFTKTQWLFYLTYVYYENSVDVFLFGCTHSCRFKTN